MVTTDEVKQIIRQELPNAIATDPAIRDFILQTSRTEMDDKFDRILGELQRDREEQSRKWDEQKREESQKWDEQARRWEEQKREESQKWDEQAQKWDEQKRTWDTRIFYVAVSSILLSLATKTFWSLVASMERMIVGILIGF